MATSIFYPAGGTEIDGLTQQLAFTFEWDIGVQFLGSEKTLLRRVLSTFDVFGAAAEGRPLTVNDTITDAVIIEDVIHVLAPLAFQCQIERITRADWDYLTADWTDYNGTLDWTTLGGDVSTPLVTYTSPSGAGEREIPGLLAFVTDAIASRGGKVHIRLKSNNENPGGSTDYIYSCVDGPTNETRPRLKVTYDSIDPQPIDIPDAGSHTLHPPMHGGQRPDGVMTGTPPAAPDRAQKGT